MKASDGEWSCSMSQDFASGPTACHAMSVETYLPDNGAPLIKQQAHRRQAACGVCHCAIRAPRHALKVEAAAARLAVQWIPRPSRPAAGFAGRAGHARQCVPHLSQHQLHVDPCRSAQPSSSARPEQQRRRQGGTGAAAAPLLPPAEDANQTRMAATPPAEIARSRISGAEVLPAGRGSGVECSSSRVFCHAATWAPQGKGRVLAMGGGKHRR